MSIATLFEFPHRVERKARSMLSRLRDLIAPQDGVGDFRNYIRQRVGSSSALEIGASYNPILSKLRFNVSTVDHLDQAGLVAKYCDMETSKIEPVDFVWCGGRLQDAIGDRRFDFVVAAHVVEHAPDLVGFLNDLAGAITSGGTVFLIVPDKRYCFDYFHPLTDTAKVLADRGRARHTFESHFRAASMAVSHPAGFVWGPGPVTQIKFLHPDPKAIRDTATEAMREADYRDAHANFFTPGSFALIIAELHYLGETALETTLLTKSRDCEFLAALRPSLHTVDLERHTRDRLCLYRQMFDEEAERLKDAKWRLSVSSD